MAEFSAPFDGSPIANQSQWSRMARRWGQDGVHAVDPADTGLKVTGNGTGNVVLAVGEAFVNGFYYRNDAVKNIAVTANAGGAARVDLVILRASMSAKSVVPVYKTGGTTAPALTADEDGVYEIPLAQCTVAAGSSVVTAVNVVDRRWFTGRSVTPGVPGARRPSVKGGLLVEGTSLYVGDGAGWRWLASAGTPMFTYTPVWSTTAGALTWGSGAKNIGRAQVVGNRVDVTIHLEPAANPPAISVPIQVSLPPGLPCATDMRPLFKWVFTSGNGEGSALGLGMTFPEESTARITRLRYGATGGASVNSAVASINMLTDQPFNIRTGDVLTIDGSYWIA
ncbi:hypothetical protein AB0387_26235 [Streptomyces sp. NPDC089173]|uniref:hypothetical protein n=1 Tax=Streptomyces sp. NPDC089173 TaxID=3154965 RepID=UPI00344BEEB0